MLPRRAIKLTIGNRDASQLSADFQLQLDLAQKANSASIVVRNAAPETRRAWSAAKAGVSVELRAGYEGETLALLWKGRLRAVTHVQNGPDWETTVSTGDGDSVQVNFSIAAGATLQAALERVAHEMAVGVPKVFETVRLAGSVIVNGDSLRELGRLVATQGKQLSVQKQQAQILPKGVALPQDTVKLTQLVGSPAASVGKDGPLVKFVHLITPELTPGRAVQIDSEHIHGRYRISKVNVAGQTHGDQWYQSCQAEPIA